MLVVLCHLCGGSSARPVDETNPLVVTAKEFAAKFQSKRECYNFCSVDNEYYVPPYGRSSFFNTLTLVLLQTTSPFTS